MKPHRTDVVSLVAGVAFLGAAGLWLAARLVPLPAAVMAVLVVGGLVVLGLAGVVYAISTRRTRRRR